MEFKLIRYKTTPHLWSILLTDALTGQTFEAHLLDVDRRAMEQNYDIEVDADAGSETFEVLRLKSRTAE